MATEILQLNLDGRQASALNLAIVVFELVGVVRPDIFSLLMKRLETEPIAKAGLVAALKLALGFKPRPSVEQTADDYVAMAKELSVIGQVITCWYQENIDAIFGQS